MLNAIGFIPGIGEIADGINAVIYYNRGMEFEALISAGCAVFPLVADAVLKPFLYAAGNAVDKVFKISQKIDGFLPTVKNFISGITTKVDNVLFGFKEAKARLKNICDDFVGYINRLSNEVNEKYAYAGISDGYFDDVKGFKEVSGAGNLKNPEIGNKLDYLFGKAKGDNHNIQRSQTMQSELSKIGIYNHLKDVLNDPSNILKTELRSYIAKELPGKPTVNYIATVRESFLKGPYSGVKIESVWNGDRLLTIIVKGGK